MFEWFTELFAWIVSFIYSLFGWDSKKTVSFEQKSNEVVEAAPAEEPKME